jgi:hypothetical protein
VTQKNVEEQAKNVNALSMDYHLTHAVFACDKLIEAVYKEVGKEKAREFNKALQKAVDEKKTAEIALLKEKRKSLDLAKFHIYIDYIDMSDPDAGRVIKVENKLVISLPKSLVADSKNEDGSYNGKGVQRLREVMAHEIGHIALHTADLLKIDGLQGSRGLDPQKEQEANWFAKELLRLRDERNRLLAVAGQ